MSHIIHPYIRDTLCSAAARMAMRDGRIAWQPSWGWKARFGPSGDQGG
jgi:hypothetical protein